MEATLLGGPARYEVYQVPRTLYFVSRIVRGEALHGIG